jgi:methyl-accepting chemotaxis protein
MPIFGSIKTHNVRKILVLTGVVVSAVPLLLLTGWMNRQTSTLAQTTQRASDQLVATNLDQQTALLSHVVDLLERGILDDLRFAQGTELGYGGVGQSRNRKAQWQATNPFTNQTATYKVPALLLGKKPIRTARTRLAEDVHQRAGASCTLFQRINGQGDMLSVLTNVVNSQGKRGIGTLIPASMPDGKANPILESVLRNKIYVGSDAHLNQNSISAYAPLVSPKDDVIGMLSVSRPEIEVVNNMRQAVSGLNLDRNASLFVLSLSPENNTRVIFSTTPAAPSSIPTGLIKQAVAHPTEPVTAKYNLAHPSGPLAMIARLEYVPNWNWVIGVAVPETRARQLSGAATEAASLTKSISLVVVAGSVLLSFIVWFRRGQNVASVIAKLGNDLERAIAILQQFAQGVCRASERQRQTLASEQAALENATRTTGELRKISEEKTAFLEAALTGPLTADSHSSGALEQLQDLETSFGEVSASNEKIRSLMQSIDDIAFQSKILALNASIEAARAGAAGASFAVVADEFGKLATRCAEAAGNTTGLLSESVKRSTRDSASLERLGSAIRQLSGGRQEWAPLVEKIQGTTCQELSLIAEITTALEGVRCAVDQAQAISERVAQAATKVQLQI